MASSINIRHPKVSVISGNQSLADGYRSGHLCSQDGRYHYAKGTCSVARVTGPGPLCRNSHEQQIPSSHERSCSIHGASELARDGMWLVRCKLDDGKDAGLQLNSRRTLLWHQIPTAAKLLLASCCQRRNLFLAALVRVSLRSACE